ncbi:MAG: hypothetical protein IJP26_05735 [Clostridia bacterium]|nr:hypothetical protein [Clostridia bacterium]
MRKRFKIFGLIFVLFLVIIALTVLSLFIRKTICEYAVSQAKIIIYKNINNSVSNCFSDNQITYNNIVNLTRNNENNVSTLEIDIVKINKLKSEINYLVAKENNGSDEYVISVPLGTLFGNEFTLGMGPQIKFKIKMVANATTDFESNFYAAGINQVLHQILIKVNYSGSVIMPWNRLGFSGETSVIAAQTVLVGVTPDAYTNVIENYNKGEDGLVGDIFDYSAEVE